MNKLIYSLSVIYMEHFQVLHVRSLPANIVHPPPYHKISPPTDTIDDHPYDSWTSCFLFSKLSNRHFWLLTFSLIQSLSIYSHQTFQEHWVVVCLMIFIRILIPYEIPFIHPFFHSATLQSVTCQQHPGEYLYLHKCCRFLNTTRKRIIHKQYNICRPVFNTSQAILNYSQ